MQLQILKNLDMNAENTNTEQTCTIDSVMTLFDGIETQDLLKAIKSDRFLWEGYDNGDTSTKYQARKCQQMAMALLVTSRVMFMEDDESVLTEESISYEQAEELFYEHIRTWKNQYKGLSDTDNIRLDVIPNLFKLVAVYLPKQNKS